MRMEKFNKTQITINHVNVSDPCSNAGRLFNAAKRVDCYHFQIRRHNDQNHTESRYEFDENEIVSRILNAFQLIIKLNFSHVTNISMTNLIYLLYPHLALLIQLPFIDTCVHKSTRKSYISIKSNARWN